jgi:prophage regulatory protein
MLLFTLTLEAYMDQQAVDVAVERRASSNRADVRFLRLKEVLAICGKSRSSVYDAIKKGDFPKPVKLSGRSSAWIKSEVEQWAVECIRASRQDQRP